MKPHEERVVEEQNELLVKTNKLVDFIDGDSETYNNLPSMEKERLYVQLFHMQKYDAILTDRIANFPESA